MKKILYILFPVLLAACTSTPEAEIPVRECAAPPEGRAAAICFAADSTVFVVSGRRQNGWYSTSMLCYDIRTDAWTEREMPLEARVNGTSCVTAHGVFLGLGYNGNPYYETESHLTDWWLFEPRQAQWTRLADFPSDKTVAAVCWSDEESIWVSNGFNGFSTDIWRYDIHSDSWVQADGQSPMRVMSPVASKCQGRYFFGTGYRRQSQSGWWEWRTDGSWEKRASVPGGRMNAACAATGNDVWVLGGWHYGDSLTTGFVYQDMLRYSPSADQWTRCGAIPCGETQNGAACALGRHLYFGLGEDKNGQLHLHWYVIED